MTKPVTVRKSLIPNAGFGLFAARKFKKREVITEYSGAVISKEQVACKSHIISIRDGSGMVIDGCKTPDEQEGAAQFANDHRDKSKINAKFVHTTHYIAEPPDTRSGYKCLGRVWLKALRNINEGEEIFVSYGRHYWRD